MLRKRDLLKELVQVALEEGLQPDEYETTTCCHENEKAQKSGDKELGKRLPYSGPQIVDIPGRLDLLWSSPASSPALLGPMDFSRGPISERLMGTLLVVKLEVSPQA